MSFNCQRCRQSLQISNTLTQQSNKDDDNNNSNPTGAASASLIELITNHQQLNSNSLSTRLALSQSLHDIINNLNSIPSVNHHNHASALKPNSKSKAKAKQSDQDEDESKRIVIEHPLCTECTSSLLEIMRHQVDAERRVRDSLVAWREEALRGNNDKGKGEDKSQDDGQSLRDEIQSLQKLYQSSTEDLRKAESQRLALEEELKQIEMEEKEMEAQELEFWASHRSSLLLHSTLSQQISSLNNSISNSKNLLFRLNSTDVYDDVFSIGQDSGVGTINGLRLGRALIPSSSSSSNTNNTSSSSSSNRNTTSSSTSSTSNKNYSSSSSSSSSTMKSDSNRHSGSNSSLNSVIGSESIEWPEINAAWGQTALLLETLRKKLELKEWENGWKIFPRGNYSWLEKIEKGNEKGEKYELYNNSNWELGKLLHSRRFDNAMVGFLDCLRQLGEIVENRSEEEDGEIGEGIVKLPHIINKDRIGGASIRLQFGNDENWTRALRNVLLTLRILLSWVVKHTSDDDDDEP